MKTSAVLSPCGLYRYSLSREWGDPTRRCLFVMLNPSVADAERTDPTTTRCIGFARELACGALDIVNLFAWRSTKPRNLALANDPVGPLNDGHIVTAATRARVIVCGWGTMVKHGGVGRDLAVRQLLSDFDLFALRLTKDGHPEHPLFIPADERLISFQPRRVAA